MQRKSVSITSMVATPMMIVCGLLFTGSSAWADDGQPTCTLKTLIGRYLFADKGTALPPFGMVTGPTPSSVAGFHLFKGDGTGTDTVTLVVNGVPVFRNAAVPLTYTVNADCTGTYTVLNGGPSFDIFVAPSGDALATIAGNSVSNISQRVSPK